MSAPADDLDAVSETEVSNDFNQNPTEQVAPGADVAAAAPATGNGSTQIIDFNNDNAQDSSETAQHFDQEELSLDNVSSVADGGNAEERDKGDKVDDPLLQNRSVGSASTSSGNGGGGGGIRMAEGASVTDDSRSQDSVSKLLCLEQQPLTPVSGGEQGGQSVPTTNNPLSSDTDNSNTSSTDKLHGGKKQKLVEDDKKSESDVAVAVDSVDRCETGNEGKASDPDSVSREGQEKRMETDEAKNIADKTVDLEEDDDDDNEVSGVRLRMEGIFEEDDDDDDDIVELPQDDSQNDDPPDIQSMLQMSFREGESQEEQSQQSIDDDIIELNSSEMQQMNVSTPSGRPRRAAATAAANHIREMTFHETDADNGGSFARRRGTRDATYGDGHLGIPQIAKTLSYSAQTCAHCKKRTICDVKVQQFGTDVYFCNNLCLTRLRGFSNRSLPCANTRCGAPKLNPSTDRSFYWETMNFCSDRCVGACQIEVGGRCATCSNSVPWLSLGKYCVRFGSDIRQFCSAPCLESYKKNARVCFHCQLDIKRLQNAILANLPAKQSPKEFCSQLCVEMYVEQNINTGAKYSQPCTCLICGENRTCHKELILPADFSQSRNANFSHFAKTCSETCWKKLLENKHIYNPVKCETCSKYLELNFSDQNASQYISTNDKVHGFCSPTCKNVFVLKNRQILACVTCKVKKYNYDLIQFFQGRSFAYATCSLNCLPSSDQYIENLRASITESKGDTAEADFGLGSFPVISSVSSMSSGYASNVYMDQPVVIDNHGNVVEAGGNESETEETDFDLDSDFSEAMKKLAAIANATDEELEVLKEIDLPGWDGLITSDIIDELLAEWKPPPETRTMSTMAKPRVTSIHTQTEESAIKDMERVPFKTQTNTVYVPFPMPFPVFIPVPTYLMETPIPYPFPLPFPVPVPIPVVFNNTPADLSSLNKSAVVDAEPDDVEMTDLDKEEGRSVIANEREENFSTESMSSSMSSAPAPVKETSSTSTDKKTKKLTRVEYGLRAWKMSFGPTSDPLSFSSVELAEKLAEWVNKGTKPNGERYRADIILYLCLGIQQHIIENGRSDNIFYDVMYSPFVDAITNYAESDCAQGINTRIEDNHFWESQQLGDNSPGVLLFTMIYFLYKNFNLKTWEKHSALHFGQIKIERKFHAVIGKEASFLRIEDSPDCDGIEVIEHQDEPDKCPVRLLSLYMSKCAHPDGQFYKAIKPDTDLVDTVWYSEEVLDQMQIYQMLARAMMIKAESDR